MQYALDLRIFLAMNSTSQLSQLCIFTSRHLSRLLLETSEPRRMRSGFLRAFAVAGWQWMAHDMGVTGGSIGTPSMNAWRGPISNSDLGKVFVEYCWYSIPLYIYIWTIKYWKHIYLSTDRSIYLSVCLSIYLQRNREGHRTMTGDWRLISDG